MTCFQLGWRPLDHMIKNRKFKEKVTVRFKKRDDGGLQAFCDAVPGFCLSGRDRAAVFRDVIPALEALVAHNLDISVEVYPLKYGLYEVIEKDDVQDIPEQQDYVIERLDAA